MTGLGANKPTPLDIYIFVFVLTLGILGILFINRFLYNGSSQTATVEIDGKLYASYNLSEFISPKKIEIKTEYGYNILEISNNGVQMTYSDCKDNLDVLQGKITKPYQSIVCLPHRLVVYLSSNSSEIDGVAS